MNCHETITFNNIKFYVHPIYNRYAASKDGQIFGKKHKIILKQNVDKGNGGYLYFNPFATEPPVTARADPGLSTLCDVIRFNGQGHLSSLTCAE